eukprot:2326901-Rhodomonas_salina.1
MVRGFGAVFVYFAAIVACCLSVPLHRPDSHEGIQATTSKGAGSLNPTSFDIGLAGVFVNFSRVTYCDHDARQTWNCTYVLKRNHMLQRLSS